MEKVLVSGAAGFIGSNLSTELLNKGYYVIGVDNFLTGQTKNVNCSLFIEHDVTKPFPNIELNCSLIFHNGDITDPRYSCDKEIYEKNLAAFNNLLALAKTNNAKFIYASTAGLYGNGPTPMKEDQEKELTTAYSKSKHEMDNIAEKHFDNFEIIGLRYFNVFGPREDHKGKTASMIYHLTKGMLKGERPKLFKWGEQKRDFIYVKDVISANLLAINAPNGIYNVGTGVSTSFNEIVTHLNEVLHTEFEIEYFDIPFDPKTYQNYTQADTNRAEKILGFKSKWQLKDAINEYVDWIKFSLQHT